MSFMTKKSLGQYYSRSYKMPHLKRQDLLDIQAVLLQVLHPKRSGIACHGFVYDRVEEIPLDSKPTVTLVVFTHEPSMRIKFARSWAEISCEEMAGDVAPALDRKSTR